MTVKSLASETTHFMTVRLNSGKLKEYTRTAFGEWCEVVIYNSLEDLRRVPRELAVELELAFHSQQLKEMLKDSIL